MTVRDRDRIELASVGAGKASSGTVALHHLEDMSELAHKAGMLVSIGTASHAFRSYEDWRRDHGELTVVVKLSGDEALGADDPVARIAEQVLAGNPSRAVARPTVPTIGDNRVVNLLGLFDLTVGEFARLFGISERHAHRWRARGVPASRRPELEALQAIGMTVIGGLGPAGAKSWLNSGEPSGAELVRQRRFGDLAARAEAVKDSPFT